MSSYVSENFLKYEAPHPVMRQLIAQFQRRFFGLIEKVSPHSVLEVGCGEGFLLDYVARRDAGLRLTGVDVSFDAVRFARDQVAADAGLLVGSAYELPFRTAEFDLVVCSEVLEHLDDVQRAVSELKRVSAQHVLISVPLEPYFRFFTGCAVSCGLGPDPGHVQFWTSGAFARLVRKSFPAMLTIERCFPYQIALCACRG